MYWKPCNETVAMLFTLFFCVRKEDVRVSAVLFSKPDKVES